MTGAIQLRQTTPEDQDRMKALWKICFGDEERYIDGFFARGCTPDQGRVLEAGGEIRSMLLPFSQEIVAPDGTALPVSYIYAFCTHPDDQGRGFGRRLLAWTEQRASRLGKRGVIMVPGAPALYDFYKTLGYRSGFSIREQVISREKGKAPLWVTTCTLEEYRQRRTQCLQGRWWVRYPGQSGTWQAQLCRDSGGGLYRVGDGLAAVERWNGAIVVKELLSRCPQQAVQSLLAQLDGSRALVRTPVDPREERKKPFGVIKWLDRPAEAWWQGGDSGYLAFAFD